MQLMRVATTSGLATLTRKKGAWSQPEASLLGEDIQVVATEPGNPQLVYAGTYGNGLFRSTNSGKEWDKLNIPDAFIRAIAFSSTDPGTVYVGTEPANLYVSSDRGSTWRDMNIRRLPESKGWSLPYSPRSGALRTLILHPSRPNGIIAGIEQGGVIRSEERGSQWTISQREEIPPDIHFLSADPQDADKIFAATGDGAYLSLDGAKTWKEMWSDYTRAILVHPSSPNLIFAGPAEDVGERGSIMFSQDGGQTWSNIHEGKQFPLPDMVEFFVIDAAQPAQVFAVLSDGDLIHTNIDNFCWRDFDVPLGQVQFMEIIHAR